MIKENMNSTNTQQVVKKENQNDDLLSGTKKRGRKSLKDKASLSESMNDSTNANKRPKSRVKQLDPFEFKSTSEEDTKSSLSSASNSTITRKSLTNNPKSNKTTSLKRKSTSSIASLNIDLNGSKANKSNKKKKLNEDRVDEQPSENQDDQSAPEHTDMDITESEKEQSELEESTSQLVLTDEEKEILKNLDLEYLKLQPSGNQSMRKMNICSVCEMTGSSSTLLECQGTCQQSFHFDCVGLLALPTDAFKCDECKNGSHICFVCKEPQQSDENQEQAVSTLRKCVSNSCGKYFHEQCAKSNPLFRTMSNGQNKYSFLCSHHTCRTCWAKNKSDCNEGTSANSLQAYKGRFVRCIRCPTAYHTSDFCVAAGSMVLTNNNIICPEHFRPIRNQTQHNRVNVSWCFVCCEKGNLIGCNQCPASYHLSCLENPSQVGAQTDENKIDSQPHSPSSTTSSHNTSNSANSNQIKSSNSVNWTCEDCLDGKRPLYGQIVWAKVGGYRWWPAQVCLPRLLPENILKRAHQVGEFAVRFFGSNDYFWLTIRRCYGFADGDDILGWVNNRKSLDVAYKRGIEEAKVAFKEIEILKAERLTKTTGREAMKNAKCNFHFIKTNKPYGNATIYKVPLADLPRCDCDPKSANPCGTDDCMNRVLKYECHPSICPAGQRCQNQRFVKKQYPKQEPIFTGERGWGLRNLVDIKKGDFVNEYVGELIDNEELKRRLDHAHQNNVHNFYFLTIDKDRVIDAGPKGNLARFINHSCDPKLETQKWLVNGDIRIGLFAVMDIPANTELTFNYNLESVSNDKAPCKCGAKNCSGFIGERPLKITNNNTTNGNTNKQEETITNKPKGSKGIKKRVNSLNVEIPNGKLAPTTTPKTNAKRPVGRPKGRSNSATPKAK